MLTWFQRSLHSLCLWSAASRKQCHLFEGRHQGKKWVLILMHLQEVGETMRDVALRDILILALDQWLHIMCSHWQSHWESTQLCSPAQLLAHCFVRQTITVPAHFQLWTAAPSSQVHYTLPAWHWVAESQSEQVAGDESWKSCQPRRPSLAEWDMQGCTLVVSGLQL